MRSRVVPWAVLALFLILTAVVTWTMYRSGTVRTEERFQNAVEVKLSRIEARLDTYVALLRGGTGLFSASDAEVTLADFREYAAQVQLSRRYPGIQGFGFTRYVPLTEVDSLEASMRRQGIEDFQVWPEIDAIHRHSIVYLEPPDERNLAAMGFDMYSNPVRQRAMDRAWETGEAAMSGRVTLVQEIDGSPQAGFLIYLAVYEGASMPATVEERLRSLKGFVYAPFRANDLFMRIVGEDERPQVAFRIYDGETLSDETLMYDSRTSGIIPASSRMSKLSSLTLGGHSWTIEFVPTMALADGTGHVTPILVGLLGVLLSLLLFGLLRAQFAAAESVERNERRLSSILEGLPVGACVVDADGRVTLSNTARGRIWEVDADSNTLVETSALEKQRGNGKSCPMQRALKGERVDSEAIEIETFAGNRKIVLTSAFPIRDKKGKIERAVSTEVDITDQKRAEALLREREAELRSMIDSIPQLAFVADASARPTWFNRQWRDFTGSTRQRLVGEGWKQFVHPDDRERVQTGFRAAIEAGETWEATFRVLSVSGEYRQFLSRAVPVRDEDHDIARWFGTSTDITDQVEAQEARARAIREQMAREAAETREQEVKRYAVELERSNRELQDFAYVASHDLQEPLRKITMFTDLVIEENGERLGAESVSYLERAQQAAVRMSDLIKDLLSFSRVSTMTQPFGPVSLNKVVAEVLADLDLMIDEHDATVHVEPLPEVEADVAQMRQLFQNIIVNAVKFRREDVAPEIHVRAHKTADGERVEIKIADNGIGFDTRYLDKIFSPFQRLHGRNAYQGTGMGLAICRRIVERHNGSISAESKVGAGSTFCVALPLEQPVAVV